MDKHLISSIEKIESLDRAKLIRKEYGPVSFEELANVLDEINYKIRVIKQHHEKVDQNTNNQVRSSLESIFNQLSGVANYDEAQFVQQQNSTIRNVNGYLNVLRLNWSQYVVNALEETGLLTNTDIKAKFESFSTDLQKSTEGALKKIEEKSEQIILLAQEKADNIEKAIRGEAKLISVDSAKLQFEEAAADNKFQIILWSIISGVLVLIFSLVILWLYNSELPDEWNWTIVYYTIIRVSVLGLIGAFLKLSLKMLKANFHMWAHNLHRHRLANSMASFVESAMSKEQRDQILSQLVNAVSQFGDSGIISSESEKSNISIDTVSKTISGLDN